MAGEQPSFITEAAPGDPAASFPQFRHPSFVSHGSGGSGDRNPSKELAVIADKPVVESRVVHVGDEDHETAVRRAELINQAEMRAEHQAMARVTMLDLARELEESTKARRELFTLLMEERAEKERILAEKEAAEAREKAALRALEDSKVDWMREKLKQGALQGSTLAVATLWSREALRPDKLDIEGLPEEERNHDLEAQVEDEEQGTSLYHLASKERSRGDGITLLWIMRAWQEQVKASRNTGDNDLMNRIRELEEELKRQREVFDKALAAEKANVRTLEARIAGLLEEIEKWKKRCSQLEGEKAELLRKLSEGTGGESGVDEMKRQLADLQDELARKNALIKEQEDRIRELEAELIRQREAFEEERKRLLAKIKELTDELQRQIVFAKHLRDMANKAKRDAAGAIPPEKFAQLIRELEEMRDRMLWLGNQANKERTEFSALKAKLDTNSRRLELERQFLPLLHKVRGPVGPKHPVLQKQPLSKSVGDLGTGVPMQSGGGLGWPPQPRGSSQ